MPEYSNNNFDIRLSVLEANMHAVQVTLNVIEDEAREHRRNDTAQTQEINSKMEALRTELKTDLSIVKSELSKVINEEIKLINKEFYEQNKTLQKIEQKLDALDKWRWLVVGFASAIGFVLAEFGKLSKFFS